MSKTITVEKYIEKYRAYKVDPMFRDGRVSLFGRLD